VPNTNPNNIYWFSVRALVNNGKGQRALAIKKNPGTFSCPMPLDADIIQLLSPSAGPIQDCQNLGSVPVMISIQNVGSSALTGIPVKYSLNGGPPVSDVYSPTLNPLQTALVTFSTPINLATAGNYSIEVWTELPGDMNRYNDSAETAMTVLAGTSVAFPYAENFESFPLCNTGPDCEATSCALLNGWQQEVNLAGDDIDFRTSEGPTPSGSTGPDVDHTLGTASGNYLYLEASQCVNRTAVLTSPCISLAGTSQPQCSFWYHMNGVNIGSLHVDIYRNGQWIYDVTPAIAGNHPNTWLQRVFDLTPYAGQIINLRFRGLTGSGNAGDLAIDDISIDNPVGIAELDASSGISIYPNPSSGLFTVSVARPGDYQVEVYDLSGKLVNTARIESSNNTMTSLDMNGFARGIYTVLIRGNETWRTRITVM
jgi:hypothetical protein